MGKEPHYPPRVRIPDWRQISVDEDFKPLKKYKARLEKENLGKDPWLRNFYQIVHFKKVGEGWRGLKFVRHGFFIGLGIFALCVIRRDFFPTNHKKYFPDGDPYLTLAEMEGKKYKRYPFHRH